VPGVGVPNRRTDTASASKKGTPVSSYYHAGQSHLKKYTLLFRNVNLEMSRFGSHKGLKFQKTGTYNSGDDLSNFETN